MAAAEKNPAALALIFGKGKPMSKEEGEPDDDDMGKEGEGSEMGGAEYEQAYREYEDNPTMETFWRAVKACVEGGY